MTTKNELAEQLVAHGQVPPANWGKLSTARAQAYVDATVGLVTKTEAPKTVGIIGHVKAGFAGAYAALSTVALGISEAQSGTPAGLDNSARKNAKRKVYSDPKYVRTTRDSRRSMNYFQQPAQPGDPLVPTRQMLRRARLDADKQPLDMSQEAWHRLKGIGNLKTYGKRRRGQTAGA